MRVWQWLVVLSLAGCGGEDPVDDDDDFEDIFGGDDDDDDVGGDDDDDDDDDGWDSALEGQFRYYDRVTEDSYCYLGWEVDGEPTSTECPDCEFAFDWAYEVDYTFSDALSDLSDDRCEESFLWYLYDDLYYFEYVLESYVGTWAFSYEGYREPPEPYDGWFAFAYAYSGGMYVNTIVPARFDGRNLVFDYALYEEYGYGLAGEAAVR